LLEQLAIGLAALAAHMEPERAARVCSQAAHTLARAMAKRENLYALADLTRGVSALAARMPTEDAATSLAQAARVVSKKPFPSAVEALAGGLWALARRTEARGAETRGARAADTLTRLVATLIQIWLKIKEHQAGAMSGQLRYVLSAILARPDPAEVSRRIGWMTTALGHSGGTGHPIVAVSLGAAFDAALGPMPWGLSTPQLVELLKQPTCTSAVRRAILDQLQYRYRRAFTDQWAFIRFAREHRLPLDFVTPPRVPEPVDFSR
jgi:hypothetical protein